jgi:hypothetical protein
MARQSYGESNKKKAGRFRPTFCFIPIDTYQRRP